MKRMPKYRIKACHVDEKKWSEVGVIWESDDGESVSVVFHQPQATDVTDKRQYKLRGFKPENGGGRPRRQDSADDIKDEDIPF